MVKLLSFKINNNFNKVLFILAIVLIANIIFQLINSTFFNQSLIFETFHKTILTFFIFILLKYNEFPINLSFTKSNLLYWAVCIIAIISSYFLLKSLIREQNLLIQPSKNLFFLLSCLSVGWFEEILFRIFIFFSVCKTSFGKTISKTIYTTSILFALAHLTGINSLGPYILNQLIFAFGIGYLLQSIYLNTSSFILIVTLHGLINYFGSYKSYLQPLQNIDNSDFEFYSFFGSLILTIILTSIFIFLGNIIMRYKIRVKIPSNSRKE